MGAVVLHCHNNLVIILPHITPSNTNSLSSSGGGSSSSAPTERIVGLKGGKETELKSSVWAILSHRQLYSSYASAVPSNWVWCSSVNKCQLVAQSWVDRLKKVWNISQVCKHRRGSVWLLVSWMHHWAWMVTCWAVSGGELRQWDTVHSVSPFFQKSKQQQHIQNTFCPASVLSYIFAWGVIFFFYYY